MTKKNDAFVPDTYREMPLRGAVYLYDESILVQKNGSTHEVDPAALAAAFSGMPISTGLLPRDTLVFQRVNGHLTLIVYLAPGRRTLTVAQGAGEKTTFTIPTPPLVFAGCGSHYRVFAVKQRPGENERLFLAPFPNVWPDGKICQGNVQFPACTPKTVHAAADLFFKSEFNHDLAGDKVRSFQGNVVDFWQHLHDTNAETFPLDQLRPTNSTLADLMALDLGKDD